MREAWTHKRVKAEAERLGCNMVDLLAQDDKNDLAFADRPQRLAWARWTAERYYEFTSAHPGRTIHDRGLYYWVGSIVPAPLCPPKVVHNRPQPPEPFRYEYANWDALQQGALDARHLGMIPGDALRDHRNPAPELYVVGPPPGPPYLEVQYEDWDAPEVVWPYYEDRNYWEPLAALREVWTEKSSLNDVVKPLCMRLGVNMQTGVGQLSYPAALKLFERICRDGRPARIAYVTDLDLQGLTMSVAVSRKLLTFAWNRGLDPDIKLYHVALTRAQVERYRLPWAPVRPKARGKEKWEEKHAEGTVEVDSLVAREPGALEGILEEWAEHYSDADWEEAYREQQRAGRRLMGARQEAIRERHRAAMEEAEADLQAAAERVAALQAQLVEELKAEKPELPELPRAPMPVDLPGALYDSRRDDLAQLWYWKQHVLSPAQFAAWQQRTGIAPPAEEDI